MLPQVKLVNQVKIDIYSALFEALGRSVTRPVDSVNADPLLATSLVVALSEMLVPGQNYYTVLKNPGSVCKHLFFSFLAIDIINHAVNIAQHTSLVCHAVPARKGLTLHLVSGNLEEWRIAIINCCSEVVPEELCSLFNEFLIKFDAIGFRDLFDTYRRKTDQDKIYLIGNK